MNALLTDTERAHLRRALELAEGGRGRVSPNPLVGAVLVREGRTIGEGFHAELGGLHAERAALEDCRRRGTHPAGATLFVTLEPCAHYGRQPPCVEAIVEAEIAKVVIASEDPSERGSGRGPGVLRDGGIEVEFAACEEATVARLLNQPFRKHARTALPLVTLKLAMSLDGQTTTAADDSPWISGEESRELVHRWRSESDAIAVGIGTVLADDPLLTARPSAVPSPHISGKRDSGTEVRQPLRVVFDSAARLPLDSQLLKTLDQAPVLVVAAADADPSRVAALRNVGAEVIAVDGSSEEGIVAALADLGQRGITSLLLEGGATLAAAFMEADAVDQCRIFVAPVLLGDAAWRAGPGAGMGDLARPTRCSGGRDEPRTAAKPSPPQPSGVEGSLIPTPPARRTAVHSEVETIGEDVLIAARFKEW
jgi:diaminohydroxyphosphoribosylaminopyrimidine deaminase/5-amino-6-(5-phosphoribosylamino)uracil reductase